MSKFKKLCGSGLAMAMVLLLTSQASADLSFWGGNMRSTISLTPTQNLTINASGVQTGTQKLTPLDTMSLSTTRMAGIVADNQYLVRGMTGLIRKTINDSQKISATSPLTGTSAGIQNTAAVFTLSSSDVVNLRGIGGNIRFESGQGADPCVEFTSFTQETVHNVPARGTSMTQQNQFTSVIASPGTRDNPLTLLATGGGNGAVGFASSIGGETLRQQAFDATLLKSVGVYNGFQQDTSLVNINSVTEAGRVQLKAADCFN